jgi:DNA polymerase (family 10)
LNDLHAHVAKLAGVKIAVSTDAHSIDAFQCMRFGIDQDTRPLAELRKLLKR